MKRTTTTDRPLRVFLCHGSEDKPAVRELYSRLRMDGVEPWLDGEDILPGQDWDMEIRQAVRESDAILVCLSSSSVGKEGYVQKEIKFALDVADEKPDRTIFIIPLRLDDCELPSRLKKWQWVSYNENDWYEKLIAALRQRGISLNLGLLPGDGPMDRIGKPVEEKSGRLLYKSVHLRELLRQSKEGKIHKENIAPQPTNVVIGVTLEALAEAMSSFTDEQRADEERELILKLVGIRVPYAQWEEKNSKIRCFQNKEIVGREEMKMQHIKVSSSNIYSIGYDTETRILEVKFHNGSVYQYYDVPAHIHDQLMIASSHGKYLHQAIIGGGYAYQKIG